MGIEISITSLAIIAIAVVMTITIAGWIMGIWTLEAGRGEVLRLLPDTYIDCKTTPPQLYLHIYSNVKPSIRIIKIKVAGVEATYETYMLESGEEPVIIDSEIMLKPGTRIWLVFSLDRCPTGMYYGAVNVYVYTDIGNQYGIAARIK